MAPDGWLWFTERPGFVSRVDTSIGKVERIHALPATQVAESGLMGMALHPDFPAEPIVYLVYSYTEVLPGGNVIYNRLASWRYDGEGLVDRDILVDLIPGGRFHNGSRLVIGPDRYLYMTTGDAQRQSLAQDIFRNAGKVLRLSLDGQPLDENPFQNEVFSYGHRNAQGIVFHPQTHDLYITEHGPQDNDEINRVVWGGNYGWPDVRGFCDNDVAGLDEITFCSENDVVEPVWTWTPTIAPSGADFYDGDLFPEWRGSLLFTTLKAATLYRVRISEDGMTALEVEAMFVDQFGRLRDVLVGGHGEVYLATSNRDGRGSPEVDDDRIIVISKR
jgi:glucose/arabinose dehydrogenase